MEETWQTVRITKPAKAEARAPRRFDPNRQPGRQYVPQSHWAPYWGVGLRFGLDGRPPFLPWRDVPRMQVDYKVLQAVMMRTSLILQSQFEVESNDESAKAWIEKTVRTAWNRLVPGMLQQYFYWGYSCCLPTYAQDRDNPGFVDLVGGRLVTPMAGTPHVWSEGPYTGQFYGIDLATSTQFGMGGVSKVNHRLPKMEYGFTGDFPADDDPMVPAPWAIWFGGMESECPLYDRNPLTGAYMPWLEKAMLGGASDTRRTYFRRAAIPPVLWRVPLGNLDPNDPNSPTCMEWAAALGASMENNSILIVPDARAPGMEGRSEPQWQTEPLGNLSQSVDVIAYVDKLDQEILQGFLIPPEVLGSDGNGSGYSGRMIPQQMLYAETDKLAMRMLDVLDLCVLRETVPHNFGERVRWRLKHIPMLEAQRRMEQQGTVEGEPAAGGVLAAPPPDEEGGGPADGEELAGPKAQHASHYVPYVGTRGGVGKKNVITGDVVYETLGGAAKQVAGNRTGTNLSVPGTTLAKPGGDDDEDEVPLGCLMAVCPPAFAARVKEIAAGIPKSDVKKGEEVGDPHVTLRYGLRELTGGRVVGLLADEEPAEVVAGKLACFEKDDCDVLYVACEDAGDLVEWNKVIDGSDLRMEPSEYGEYVPHVTVAYLKPGKGKKYVGDAALEGHRWLADTLEYHRPDGGVDRLNLWPGEDSLRSALLGSAR